MSANQLRKKIKKELQGSSLAIKWALASSFFIFIVFTSFAFITYKTSVNLIVKKERTNLEYIIKGVTDRLSNITEDLTVTTTMNQLKTSMSTINDLDNKKIEIEGSLDELDSFIAELGAKPLFLTIYSNEKKLLFKTQPGYTTLLNTKNTKPKIQTIDQKTGFLITHPIYSKNKNKRIGYVQAFYELSSFYDMRSRLLVTLLILEVISLILSSILGFILPFYFLKPLKLLKNTMDTIRKDPQSDVHVPKLQSNDELSDLAEIFNEMLDRMRRYIEQQEQFVEDVSHELRTPVAIIEGHLSLLNRWGKEDPKILDESLTASLQEITRMKSLVQEMLDLSRVEQVDIQYASNTINAKQVIYQVFNNFKLIYLEFTITLDDDLAEEVMLNIYRNHLEQLLIVLLDNAVKYSTTRKEVHISISRTRDNFEVAIQDFGEGIPKVDLEKIFNRFYRVDKARARNKGGNGLGLSIAKKIVENYKGRIEVESVINQGTVFHIFIPIFIKEENNDESKKNQ